MHYFIGVHRVGKKNTPSLLSEEVFPNRILKENLSLFPFPLLWRGPIVIGREKLF
jgi:hypothetical protein